MADGNTKRGPARALVCNSGAAIAAMFLGMGVAGVSAVWAGEGKTVLELFTSQSCSSCPPADELLKKYSSEPGVIALSFPVDYWDYTGWKDTLATPENADRQQFYAGHCVGGTGRVYTPQMAVNGMALVRGSSEVAINDEIRRTSELLDGSRVPIRIDLSGDGLTVSTGVAAVGNPSSGTVLLAAVTRSVEVEIRKGENAGKKVTYWNVVRQITPLGKWTGSAASFRVPHEKFGDKPADLFVAILQADDDGSILGAADASR